MEYWQVVGIMLLSGLLGIYGHYLKQWLAGNIAGSLTQYLFVDHVRATGLTVFGYISTAGAMVLSGQLNSSTVVALISLGLSLGYSADSIANKGTVPPADPAVPTP